MDIARLSMSMSSAKVAQEAGVSILKMAMDSAEGESADIAKMLEVNTRIIEQALPAHLGNTVNIEA